MQGLIDHYQPASPVEHHLIQQVAMGMLRQHRLWSAEAAEANAAIAKQQRDILLPETLRKSMDALEWLSYHNSSALTAEQTLEQERNVISQVMGAIVCLKDCAPKRRLKVWGKTPAAIDLGKDFLKALNTAKEKYQKAFIPTKAELETGSSDTVFWCLITEAISLEYWLEHEMLEPYLSHCLPLLETRLDKRMGETHALLKKLATLTREQQLAQQQVTAIAVNPLLADYEGRINKSLYDAIDRLEAMKESR